MDHIELGKRLRAARDGVGLNQQDVADDLKLPRTAISLIESGQRQVSTIELTQMAALYRRPVSEFLQPNAFESEDYLVVLHRLAPELKGDPQVQVDVETCLDLCRIGVGLEKALGREERQGPPDFAVPMPRTASDAVTQGVEIAAEERRRLGLGSAPIRNISARINEQGVWAVKSRLGTDMAGFFMHHPTIGLVVITNAGHVPSRRRFSFAHEYGHALMDRDRRVQVTTTRNSEDLVEMRANAFAAAFLLPANGVEHFLAAVGKGQNSRQQQLFYDVASNGKFDIETRQEPYSQTITPQDIAMLAMNYGVSYDAVAYRLNTLRYLDRAQTQELLAKAPLGRRYIELLGAMQMGDDSGMPAESSEGPELRSQILHLAMEAFRREEISQGRLLEIGRKLGIDSKALLDLVHDENPLSQD
jgi:Zn-dependent peptidase ImmA (M78 family)/transcriptional regulator with XRE-family HTH domain